VAEKSKLLVVDDDEAIRTQMRWAFASDYEVLLAEDRATALALVRSDLPPVVTLDLGLPPKPHDPSEGIRALSEILDAHAACKVIVITGQEERDNALRAIAQGAYDFFTKPIRIAELEIVVRRALQVYRLEEENRALQRRATGEPFEEMLGSSRAMQEVFATIRKAAPSDSAVLITGETGTGKELTARAVHRLSERRAGPFVPINCGAIPENLLEAELFGHEKGAFTDAHVQRKGRVELAHGGTLFLDEIGELSPNLQVALLRYLQEGKLQRVGGRTDISVDARLIAATNADLAAAIRKGEFREDLYYRLSVVVIRLPPLREREEDVALLASALVQKYAASNRRRITGFTKSAQEAIKQYAWPGNIRELENRIKRAVIMSTGPKLTPADLELQSQFARYEGKGLKEARAELERELIEKAMARHGGNITQVAAELGVSRPTLYELMGKLAIGKQ
jgi:two-component system NtrC family response regulator